MSQAVTGRRPHARFLPSAKWYGVAVVLLIAVVSAFALRGYWFPLAQSFIETGKLPSLGVAGASDQKGKSHEADAHDHAGHDHSHAGHNESNSIELSEQARKNIGLTLAQVELKPFTKTIPFPGIVVERPGRSLLQTTAPMTGIVTKIYPLEGEAVEPEQPLFDIRLTHEELVQAQSDLLRTIEELDVNAREIARIEDLVANAALPGKTLLERKYERQKLEAALRSQKQTLLLHGLAQDQVDAIARTRTLRQTLTVTAPAPTDRMSSSEGPQFYQVQSLKVVQGQHVTAGDPLAELVDHSELYIAGSAFERDLGEITDAAASGQTVSALIETEGKKPQTVSGLSLLYAASRIDPETRTLHFYVVLPNQRAHEVRQNDGRRYVSWRYRPGQRTQLLINVETWQDRIVLPIDAVVQEGPETYVFTANGDHFDRRPVHVEYKDQLSAVIANDGSLFPGDTVALSAALQIQLALKNKAGGGVDPHAGHNH